MEYFQLEKDYQKLRKEMAQRMHEDKMREWDKRHEQLNEMIKKLRGITEVRKENNPKIL
ncbi:hypothetical protein [Priestia aryabhattai]